MLEQLTLILAENDGMKFLAGIAFVLFWAISASISAWQKKKEEEERQRRRAEGATYEQRPDDLPPVLPPHSGREDSRHPREVPPPLPDVSDGGQVRTRAEMERRIEAARRKRAQQQHQRERQPSREPEASVFDSSESFPPPVPTSYPPPPESDMERLRRQQAETRRQQEMFMRQQEAARQELERRKREIERQKKQKARRVEDQRRAEAAEVAEQRRQSAEQASRIVPLEEHRPHRNAPSGATAATLNKWLTPQTLRQQYILTELFSPPVALRPNHLDGPSYL